MKISVALSMAIVLAVALYAVPGYGDNLVLGAGGRVTIELMTSDALFSNTLSLVSPKSAVLWARGCKIEFAGGLTGQLLMSEKTSQHGCRAELDFDWSTDEIEPFPAGTELEFNLCAKTTSNSKCDYIWSSNPIKNTDGYNHVHFTELYSTEWPGRIYLMEWEDLPKDESDDDFNDLIAVVRVEMDSDGDGLWDDWEKYGIDTNNDGTPELDLPSLGADPNHKDIFVWIDYMDCAQSGGDCAGSDTHSHKPKDAAIAMVKQAFADAPVNNPDKKPGINLHLEVNPVAIPHKKVITFAGTNTEFDALKKTYFGTDNPRRFAYHYAIFAHQFTGSTFDNAGQAEKGGNDFIVTFGGWNESNYDYDKDGLDDKDVGTVFEQAQSLMHELGHNLNLGHGGGDCINGKPNYLSIMNYRFTKGIPPSNRIDYSREALPMLNEKHLDETKGIGDGTDQTTYQCGWVWKTVSGTGSIDWNCNDIYETDVQVDINNYCDDKTIDCNCTNVGTFVELYGYNDWEKLRYTFQNITLDFEDGVHLDLAAPEMDYAAYLLLTPPDITIITPQANEAVQDGVTLQAEASSVRIVAAAYFYVREGNSGSGVPIGYDDLPGTFNTANGKWEYHFDTTLLQDGYYMIMAKAVDTEGIEGWSAPVPFSIRNWAVIKLLPSTPSSKAGRTMPVKFSLRIAATVDPAMPFVYNEDLEIRIYRCNNESCSSKTLMQTSTYGIGATDYRINGELYITNFKTTKTPAQYLVEIWRPTKSFVVGDFSFKTVK